MALQGVHLANFGGDVNSDGRDDIAMGVQAVKTPYNNSGGVYITKSSDILIAGDQVNWFAHIHGEYENDQVGFIASAGDIDRDGITDILVGMNGNEERAYISSWNSSWHGKESEPVPMASTLQEKCLPPYPISPETENQITSLVMVIKSTS